MAGKLVKDVPVVMQMEATECGAACMCMILAYYGRWITLEQARIDCGVGRDGAKAKNIIKAARAYGMEADGYAVSLEALREKGIFPCILFWNFSHFVVLTGFKGNYAYINDPAQGAVKVDMEEFDRSFTGVMLTLRPGEDFEPGGAPASTADFVRSRLKGTGSTIAFVALATALASIAGIILNVGSTVFMDYVLSGESPQWLRTLLNVLAIAVVSQCVVSVSRSLFLNRMRGKFAVVSSSRFMWHMLHLPVGFYAQRMVGDLQQRQESNESIASTLLEQLAPALFNSFLLIAYLVVMVAYSWKLTIVGVVAMLVNSFLAEYISRRRVNITRQHARDMGMLYGATYAGIETIETIKASGAEDGFFERWAGYQALANNASTRFAKTNLYLGGIPELVSQLAHIVVLLLGAYLIMRGAYTAGALLAFQGLLYSFAEPVQSLIGLGQQVQEMRTSMERVLDVMEYPTDVQEDEEFDSDADHPKLSGALEVDHLSFGYSPLEPPLIEDLTLSVKPGEWVALVGASGSGKSTVAKLLCGLYEPWGGEIRYDGVPLREVPPSQLRASVAMVDQDIVMFDGTVADNIRLWDHSIEDFEVILAANDADIHHEIMAREGGYYGEMRSGGSNYSGGQLQRIEIARVLAQDPTIIVMDEATSALDAKTEKSVIDAIRRREVTCVVVAHRLSTIRDCDEIIVLDEGRVVERGTHDELMALDGAYAELVRNS